jgi:signal transduction histidine kinase
MAEHIHYARNARHAPLLDGGKIMLIRKPARFFMQKIVFMLGIFFMTSSICSAQCVPNSVDLPLEAFKGHAVFVWKEETSYSFIWTLATDALIPRKEVAVQPKVDACTVMKQMEKMKGLEQFIFLHLIENPYTASFLDVRHNPMRPREEFSDLIERLAEIVRENEIYFYVRDRESREIHDGF